jgi:hypothetical protein
VGLSQPLVASSFSASQEISQLLWNLCSQDISTGPCSEYRMHGVSGQPYSPLKSFACRILQEPNPGEVLFLVILMAFHEHVMVCINHELY